MSIRTLGKEGPDGKWVEVSYDDKNPAERKQAWMTFWEESEIEYDRREAEMKKEREEFKKKYPLLDNLVWADGEMYYVDDDGNRLDDIETAAHLEKIKSQISQCFSDISPKEPLKLNGVDVDRNVLLESALDETSFSNNAKDFILSDED